MAKSEKKVTKGFGFYLLMLLLIIAAAFLIIVCVMMFSPKNVILGYQYFVYSGQDALVATTDKTESPINFSSTDKIIVNCHNAKVSIIKSDMTDKDNVVIVHNVNGFASSADNVDMTYSVVYEGRTLKIDVNEPQGFLYLTSDVQVIIRVPSKSSYKFENTEFDITTTSGSVVVGNTSPFQNLDINLSIKNLSVSTDNGNVVLTQYNNADFNNIFVNTNSGSFTNQLEKFNVLGSMRLTTGNGSINLNNFAFKTGVNEDKSRILELNLGNGRFNAKELTASISFVAGNASINIDKVAGSFDGNETSEKIDRSQINIGEVGGSVSLPNVKASDVNIKRIGGQVNIQTTSGNINIGEIGEKSYGLTTASSLRTDSGNITAVICDSTIGKKHNFKSNSGAINLIYKASIISENNIESVNGNVEVSFGSDYKFLLTLKDALGELYEKLNDKIDLTFVAPEKFTNPLRVNDYNGTNYSMEILTNGNIKASLI